MFFNGTFFSSQQRVNLYLGTMKKTKLAFVIPLFSLLAASCSTVPLGGPEPGNVLKEFRSCGEAEKRGRMRRLGSRS